MKISSMKYNLRRKKVHQDENPLEMMANLMDVMLVFACGLMLALIVNWNVDLGGQEVDYVSGQEITETQLNENKSESRSMKIRITKWEPFIRIRRPAGCTW